MHVTGLVFHISREARDRLLHSKSMTPGSKQKQLYIILSKRNEMSNDQPTSIRGGKIGLHNYQNVETILRIYMMNSQSPNLQMRH